MKSLGEYFPRHGWFVVIGFAGLASVGLFVPPEMTASFGLSLAEHVIALGLVQFTAAVGIGSLVVAYRDPEPDDSEWRFDP